MTSIAPALHRRQSTVRAGLIAWLAVAFLLGCARRYPLPMTAAELTGYGEAAALVAYLSQPDASPSVCDLQPGGPHLGHLDLETRQALDRGFRDGKIAPRTWAGCLSALLASADPATAAALVDDVLQAALDTLLDPGLEFDAAMQARLDALQQVYLERPAGLGGRPGNLESTLTALEHALERKRFGPAGQRRAADLQAILSLETGRWHGRPVDGAVLDELQEAGDEGTLRWAADRLPGEPLRAEARRRIVRLHLRASPFPEVRQEAAAVEAAVLRLGANPVSLSAHPPERGWLDPTLGSAREVLVEQRLPDQTARLLAYSSDRPTPAVLPALPTRGSLHLELRGVARPVTLCAPARALDVTPCLAPGEIRLGTGLASLDPGGVLHFTDSITEAAAVALAQGGRRLSVPFLVAGQRVASLEWPVSFARPADLVLAGTKAGGPGPDLEVLVDGRDPAQLVYSVTAGAAVYQAVVERAEAQAFHVVSRGAAGEPGSSGFSGTDGSSGADGWSASCPSFSGSSGSNGGNGSDGGSGGAGGPGGGGGDVRVTVTGGPRDELVRLLATTVLSQGGPGGPGGTGGAGGSGGRGGRGGSGATCTDSDGHTSSLSGGMDGANGSDGSRGADGPSGASGQPGRVRFTTP